MSRKFCCLPRAANRDFGREVITERRLFLTWISALKKFISCQRHCDVIYLIKSSVVSQQLLEEILCQQVKTPSVAMAKQYIMHGMSNIWASESSLIQ